jgi:hypothetical protein
MAGRARGSVVRNLFYRILHEMFPFVRYLRAHSAIMKELASFAPGRHPLEGPTLSAVRAYCGAKPLDLEEALIAQQTRATALDEKTFRHAASVATALTVASAATTAVAQLLSSPFWKMVVTVPTFLAIVYVMAGGMLGIAAARTLPGYGTGIRFRIEQDTEAPDRKPYVLAEALACQERMNNIRVARNEAAFMSIRNGFFCIVVAVCALLIGVQFAAKDNGIERKIWPASFGGASTRNQS